jgi:hypothetical protein
VTRRLLASRGSALRVTARESRASQASRPPARFERSDCSAEHVGFHQDRVEPRLQLAA